VFGLFRLLGFDLLPASSGSTRPGCTAHPLASPAPGRGWNLR
jgi:hypothetical protein